MPKIKTENMNKIAQAVGVRSLPEDDESNYPSSLHRVTLADRNVRVFTSDAVGTWISHAESLEDSSEPLDLWVAARPFNRLFGSASGGNWELDQEGLDLRLTYNGACILAGRTRPGEHDVNLDEESFKSHGMVSAAKLRQALEWLQPYINPSALRPDDQVLTLGNDGKGYAATGTVCAKVDGVEVPFSFSLTAPIVRTVLKWLQALQPEKLEIKMDDHKRLLLQSSGSSNYLVVVTDDRVAPAKAFDLCEKYAFEETLIVDCESLKAAVARVMACSDSPGDVVRLTVTGNKTPVTADMAAQASLVVSTPLGYREEVETNAARRNTAKMDIVRVVTDAPVEFEVCGDLLMDAARRMASPTMTLRLLKKRGFLLATSEHPQGSDAEGLCVQHSCLMGARYMDGKEQG